MELTRNHRRCLLAALKEASAKKETLTRVANSKTAEDDADFLESVEIDLFLINQQIFVIEESLCANDIDH